jgi:hypothetical protein
MTFKHREHGTPSRVWTYYLAGGELAGYVTRFDFINAKGERDKHVLPVTFCDLGNG